MKQPATRGALSSKVVLLSASAAILAVAAATPSYAQSNTPIKIGVIAEAQAVAGSSIPQAAQLAADEINAAGGLTAAKSRSSLMTTTRRRPNPSARSSAQPPRITSMR